MTAGHSWSYCVTESAKVIGHNATLKPGAAVGNGAVVLPHSTVTGLRKSYHVMLKSCHVPQRHGNGCLQDLVLVCLSARV